MRIRSARGWAHHTDPDHPERWRKIIAAAVRSGEMRAVRRGPAYLIDEDEFRRWWRSQMAPIGDDAREWARERVRRAS